MYNVLTKYRNIQIIKSLEVFSIFKSTKNGHFSVNTLVVDSKWKECHGQFDM